MGRSCATARSMNFVVVGEIGEHAQIRTEGDNRDKVRCSHLLLEEFFGSVVGALDVIGGHRSEIEKEDEHAAVANLVANGLRKAAVLGAIDGDDDGLLVGGGRRSRWLPMSS